MEKVYIGKAETQVEIAKIIPISRNDHEYDYAYAKNLKGTIKCLSEEIIINKVKICSLKSKVTLLYIKRIIVSPYYSNE